MLRRIDLRPTLAAAAGVGNAILALYYAVIGLWLYEWNSDSTSSVKHGRQAAEGLLVGGLPETAGLMAVSLAVLAYLSRRSYRRSRRGQAWCRVDSITLIIALFPPFVALATVFTEI